MNCLFFILYAPNKKAHKRIKDKDNNDVTVKAFSEITFSLEKGNEESIDNIKKRAKNFMFNFKVIQLSVISEEGNPDKII